jgi:hypothetical protein
MLLDWLIYGLLIYKYEIIRLAQDDKTAFRRGLKFFLNSANRPDSPSLLPSPSGYPAWAAGW